MHELNDNRKSGLKPIGGSISLANDNLIYFFNQIA